MYLSTRISRLCKRSPFLSLSLSTYLCVCVCVIVCVIVCVCVCVCVCFGLVFQSLLCMGGMEGIISLLVFKIISYFPYLLLFFSSFLMIFPLPAMATKLPLSFPLLVMFMCVCVCVFLTFYFCTSYFNRVAKFFGLLVSMYKYIQIKNLY